MASKARRDVPLDEAIARVRGRALSPERETVALGKALGRVLAEAVTAQRDQPPFRSSAMDGYAVRRSDIDPKTEQLVLAVVGESSAGRRFGRAVGPGEAVRIFTGAPVPDDCDAVVIQENTRVVEGGLEILPDGRRINDRFIRKPGQDFVAGQVLCEAGARLDPWRLSLVAAAGLAEVTVTRRPRISVLCTGDELVLPGNDPNADQIYESASHAIMALIKQWGGKPTYLGVKGDDAKAIHRALKTVDADLIVTVGGASVGDYDLVKPALEKLGLELEFETLRLKPGKPTAFGVLQDGRRVLGLPGNPASCFVVAQLILKPWIELSLGMGLGMAAVSPYAKAVLLEPLAANGPRETFYRAKLSQSVDGRLQVAPFADQDSSLVAIFAQADALLRIPSQQPAMDAGAHVEILPLDRMG
ncbi:MAG TPA: gephyrin-like molybdotransferase Glp [Asticcacaulis sp.]|nr:gephyrin-like molybdotransferase Glp [Asticcacaulis sp.]